MVKNLRFLLLVLYLGLPIGGNTFAQKRVVVKDAQNIVQIGKRACLIRPNGKGNVLGRLKRHPKRLILIPAAKVFRSKALRALKTSRRVRGLTALYVECLKKTQSHPQGVLGVNPLSDFIAQGTSGGPIAPAEKVYTLRNTGEEALAWSASVNQPWLKVSPASGVLEAGKALDLTVGFTQNQVSLLLEGEYKGELSFANLSNASGNTVRGVLLSLAKPPLHASAVSQYGVTWTFDQPYPVGQFVNGDWWVVGPLTISAMHPQNLDGMHGWLVNPAIENKQAYDFRLNNYDSSLTPALPYRAMPGDSIIKVESVPYVDGTWSDCAAWYKHCILRAAVLTVVAEPPPPDSFRPPYTGSLKEFFLSRNLRSELLPALPATPRTPTREAIESRVAMARLDYSSSSVSQGNYNPYYAYPGGANWGADVARSNAEMFYWLALDFPLSEKLPTLQQLVQLGIDLYGNRKFVGTKWVHGGGGNGAGRLLPIVFAAMMLDAPEIQQVLDEAVVDLDYGNTFWESEMYKKSPHSEAVLWGNAAPWFSQRTYWKGLAIDEGFHRHGRDPYGYIDGGTLPGRSYQAGTSLPTKYQALVLHLYPEMKQRWPENEIKIINYADRWSAYGTHSQPDPCAPVIGICLGGSRAGAVCSYADYSACPEGSCAGGVCTGGSYEGAPCHGTRYRSEGGAYSPAGPSPNNDCGDGSCDLNPVYYGVAYGPDGQGACIADVDPSDGIGRWPLEHHVHADSQGLGPAVKRSVFGDEMWAAYRHWQE